VGEPLVVEFDVEVPPQRAFEVWTGRCAMWWPSSHTVSGDPSTITFEPRAGGRIVEHAPGGEEHDWGMVLDWEPPRRLRFTWHLFFDPADATEVDLTFTAAERGTRVRLEQRGFERLGEGGATRRARTEVAWSSITKAFRTALLHDL